MTPRLASAVVVLAVVAGACSGSSQRAGSSTEGAAATTIRAAQAQISTTVQAGPSTNPLSTTLPVAEADPAPTAHPGHYLIAGSPLSDKTIETLQRVEVFRGVSVVYDWVTLETSEGVYDFSQVKADLERLRPLHKQMTIMLRDKSFANNQFVPVPEYLLAEEYLGGYLDHPGRVSVATRWVPAVSERFRALISALGEAIGDVAEVEGVKTSESATANQPGSDFDVYEYARQLELDADAMAEAFPGRANFLYLNWGLGQRRADGTSLMRDVALHAASVGVGIGGPDVHPDVDIPAYPLYPLVAATVPTMVEVQYSDYDHTAVPGDTEQLYDFAVNSLDVSYIAWQPRPPYVDAMEGTVLLHADFAG